MMPEKKKTLQSMPNREQLRRSWKKGYTHLSYKDYVFLVKMSIEKNNKEVMANEEANKDSN